MALDLVLVAEGFEPHETIRVDPHRVVDPGEVHVDVAAALIEKVRQQKRHLVEGERPLVGQVELVPGVERRRLLEGLGNEFVPGVERRAAFVADRAGQHVDEEQAAGHLPAAQVAHRRRAPHVGGDPVAGLGHQSRGVLDAVLGHL